MILCNTLIFLLLRHNGQKQKNPWLLPVFLNILITTLFYEKKEIKCRKRGKYEEKKEKKKIKI